MDLKIETAKLKTFAVKEAIFFTFKTYLRFVYKKVGIHQ